ncbi:MAG TPA: zinc ribbon domain-containing protein [Candidatus Saccharimonadales bacterium]|nr:zinc ribbon domain-containing protein [Candidatus Saccharimonadales bacterium]
MPRYDYDCANCGRRTELIHGVHDDAPTVCPSCGGGPLRKAFSTPSIHFKGSGWAKKERRATVAPGARSGSASDDGAAGGGSSDDGGSGEGSDTAVAETTTSTADAKKPDADGAGGASGTGTGSGSAGDAAKGSGAGKPSGTSHRRDSTRSSSRPSSGADGD